MQTNRSALHFEVGSDPITNLHHTKEHLVTQEKGGTITVYSISNSSYVKERSIPGNHLGYCRTALHINPNNSNEQLLFYPCEEAAIGVLHVTDPAAPTQMLMPDDPQLPKLGSVTCFKPFECASQLFLLAGYESGHFLTWDLSSGCLIDTLELAPEALTVDYDSMTNRGIIGGTCKSNSDYLLDLPPTDHDFPIFSGKTDDFQLSASLDATATWLRCVHQESWRELCAHTCGSKGFR